MLPTAGLYLPDTLHRQDADAISQKATQNAGRKYFERTSKLFDRKFLDRKNLERKSAETSRTSMDDANAPFSSLPTVFNFIDFAVAQEDVSADNKVFVNLIHRVRHDVNEALRLRALPAIVDYCEAVPDKEAWIDAVLLDVKGALNDIGLYMENVRISGDSGSASALKRKFQWVLGHHQKLLTREISLSMCHQSLTSVIQFMQLTAMQAEVGGTGSYELEGSSPMDLPNRPWLQDDGDVLRSPYSRQKWRLSKRNLSLPSIMVSEAESEKIKGMIDIH